MYAFTMHYYAFVYRAPILAMGLQRQGIHTANYCTFADLMHQLLLMLCSCDIMTVFSWTVWYREGYD